MADNHNDQTIIDLVIARLESLPEGTTISVGSQGDFTKEELIRSVKAGDEIGKQMIEVELSFLQSLKEGILYGPTPAAD